MNNERYVRWQGYTISQFTFAINLFLGLAVGALAFSITLLKEENFVLGSCLKKVFLIGIIALCLSVVSGCCAVVSRLMDFRLTAKKIRAESKDVADDELGAYTYKTKFLGRLSWRLFWFEIGTLTIGLFGVIAAIFGKYGGKII